jgi:hypothetical protein
MTAGWVVFLVTAIGAAILGFALFSGMSITKRRRQNPVAEQVSEEATRDLYEEEAERERRK